MSQSQTNSADHFFVKQVIEAEANALNALADHLPNNLSAAIDQILQCTGAIIITGVGKSGLIGQKISATLASTGTTSHFVHPTEAMHGDVGRIHHEDVVLALSYSGETDEVLALVAILRQDNIPILSMTGNAASHLAKLSDIHLDLGKTQEACPHNLAPTVSTSITLAMGDALALCVAQRKGFTPEEFQKLHPGGSLGRQMTRIKEALRFRIGRNLKLVSDHLSVQDALGQSDQKRRAGALMLVNADGKLSGIFTDADLRRLLVTHGQAGLQTPIASVMTSTPIKLYEDQFLKDAIQVIRENRLDEIPIINNDGQPVGLLDVQDLIALKLIEA